MSKRLEGKATKNHSRKKNQEKQYFGETSKKECKEISSERKTFSRFDAQRISDSNEIRDLKRERLMEDTRYRFF
jgi:hypothetical protein